MKQSNQGENMYNGKRLFLHLELGYETLSRKNSQDFREIEIGEIGCCIP